MKGNIPKYIRSDHNVVCDVCGRKRKWSECVMAYGSGTIPVVMSCRDGCADYNHPLNYPPPIIFDGRPVPDARPDQVNNVYTFVPEILPAYFFWGSFPGGNWGHFNGLNNEFNLNGIWVWGGFSTIY